MNSQLVMNSFGLCNKVTVATNVDSRKGCTTTLLDHIWHNLNKPCRTFVFDVPIADHLPVFTIYNNKRRKIFRLVNHLGIFLLKCNKVILNNVTEEISKFNIQNTNPGKSISCYMNWSLLNKYFKIKIKSVFLKRIKMP